MLLMAANLCSMITVKTTTCLDVIVDKLSPNIYGDTSHQHKRPHKLLDQELLKNRVGYPQPGSGIIQIT